MQLLFVLLFAVASHADDIVTFSHDTPVYKTAAPGARVLFYVHPGETATASPSTDENFLRVKAKYKGKTYAGFVQKADVESDELADENKSGSSDWGMGGGLEYVSLMQKGKSFQTDDQVQYTTTDYKSTALAPFLTLQLNQLNFWRLTVAQKKTHYTAIATTNLVGSNAKAVDLQQTFYSALLQKAWMPAHSKNFYFGIGGEIAKATSVDLTLGTLKLPVSSSDMPLYLGAMLFGGGSLSLNHSLSLYGEARIEYIANQTPGILDVEGAVGLMYWP